MFSICLLSYSLSRLWLCAPAARNDVNCARQHIHVRVRTVHVLLIPGSALNRVSISKFTCLETVGDRIGWPAHMGSLTPVLENSPEKNCQASTINLQGKHRHVDFMRDLWCTQFSRASLGGGTECGSWWLHVQFMMHPCTLISYQRQNHHTTPSQALKSVQDITEHCSGLFRRLLTYSVIIELTCLH